MIRTARYYIKDSSNARRSTIYFGSAGSYGFYSATMSIGVSAKLTDSCVVHKVNKITNIVILNYRKSLTHSHPR